MAPQFRSLAIDNDEGIGFDAPGGWRSRVPPVPLAPGADRGQHHNGGHQRPQPESQTRWRSGPRCAVGCTRRPGRRAVPRVFGMVLLEIEMGLSMRPGGTGGGEPRVHFGRERKDGLGTVPADAADGQAKLTLPALGSANAPVQIAGDLLPASQAGRGNRQQG